MRIQGRLANVIINRCDFFIRFAYCRLGLISRMINRTFFWNLYSSGSPQGLDNKFESMFDLISQHGIDIKNKTIVEIGPGNSFINAYNLLARGAKKIIIVDKYPRYIQSRKQKAYADAELDFIKKKYGQHLYFLDDLGKIKAEYIDLFFGDLESVGKIQADFVFSHGVLEHIKNIRSYIDKNFDLLIKGGSTFHYVNLLDHYNFSAPYLFLKYSDWVWNNLLTKEGLSYTNRWRYSDYMSAFRQSGFNITYQAIDRIPVTNIRLNRKFMGYKDLDVAMFTVILNK